MEYEPKRSMPEPIHRQRHESLLVSPLPQRNFFEAQEMPFSKDQTTNPLYEKTDEYSVTYVVYLSTLWNF